MGFKWGPWLANIGLGDLLLYGLFTAAAYKGFGRRGGMVAVGVVTVFGALVPSFAPLVIQAVTRAGVGVVVPAQIFFGPAAALTYVFLSRHQAERSMRDWYVVQAQQQAVSGTVGQSARTPIPEAVPAN